MAQHQLVVRTEVLDQIAKSLMLSITANTKRRRRLDPKTKTGKDAADEAHILNEAFTIVTDAQDQSWEEVVGGS